MQLELTNRYIRPEMEDGINLIYFNEKLERCEINIPQIIIYKDKVIYNYEEGTSFYLTIYLSLLEDDVLNKILEIHTLYEIKIKLRLKDYSYVVYGEVDGVQILSLKEHVKLILAKKSIGYNASDFIGEDDYEMKIKDKYCCSDCQMNLLSALGYKLS